MEQRSPAVVAYVKHLTDIASTDPVRLIAHAYTQHMALLAGGQRIRKFVASSLPGMQGQEGMSVFSFKVCPGTTLMLFLLPSKLLHHSGMMMITRYVSPGMVSK